jgi:hypothetical protein
MMNRGTSEKKKTTPSPYGQIGRETSSVHLSVEDCLISELSVLVALKVFKQAH